MTKRIFLLLMILTCVSGFAKSRRKDSLNYDLQAELLKTSTPADGDVCFSPEEHCDAKLIKFVESAQASLDIAIYDINHEQLVHQILIKAKKMPVRVLVDERQAKGSKSLVDLLAKGGANVRYGRQRGIMHNKFIVVDGKALETGSFNFTHHASLANNENQIYLTSPKIVKRYHERFAEIWEKGKPVPSARGLSGAF